MTGLHQLALRFLVFEFASYHCQSLIQDRNSDFSSANFLCAASAVPLLFLGPLARVLDGQRGGDDQHFVETAFVTRSDDHARHTRVERQLGEFLPIGVSARLLGDGTEFLQQLVAIVDRLGRRRFEEREGLDVAEAQRFHAQDDAGQRRTQDLGIA